MCSQRPSSQASTMERVYLRKVLMMAEARITYSKENSRCTLALFSSVLPTRYFRNALSMACAREAVMLRTRADTHINTSHCPCITTQSWAGMRLQRAGKL